jgi:hypothetical protein
MTASYRSYFVLVWASAVLAVPGSFAFCVLAYLAEARGLAYLYAGAAVFCVVWTVFLRLHGQRVLIRSGAWPNLCSGDFHARPLRTLEATRDELKAEVARMRAAYGRPPRVVGSGWGYFLQRAGPRGARLFLHELKGGVPGEKRTCRRRLASAQSLSSLRTHAQECHSRRLPIRSNSL